MMGRGCSVAKMARRGLSEQRPREGKEGGRETAITVQAEGKAPVRCSWSVQQGSWQSARERTGEGAE